MSESTIQTQSLRYKLGWGTLFLLSLLGVLSQSVLIVVDPDLVVSFVAWATFLLYSVFVLLIPYRRYEKWAWFITWILIAPFTVVGIEDPDAAPYFWAAAGLVVVCQLLNRAPFFSK